MISDLRGRERNGLIKLPPPPKPIALFLAGDELRIRSGPFTGLHGLYAGMAPRERIFVLLQMLGGERTIELAQGDVSGFSERCAEALTKCTLDVPERIFWVHFGPAFRKIIQSTQSYSDFIRP